MRRRILITKRTARRRASRQRPAQMAPPLPEEVATDDSSLFKQVKRVWEPAVHYTRTQRIVPVPSHTQCWRTRGGYSTPIQDTASVETEIRLQPTAATNPPPNQASTPPTGRPEPGGATPDRETTTRRSRGGGPAPLTPAGAAPTHRRRRRREPNGGPTGWTYSKLRRHT